MGPERVHMSEFEDEQTVPNVQGDEGARDRDKDNKEHTMIHARTDAYVLTLLKGPAGWFCLPRLPCVQGSCDFETSFSPILMKIKFHFIRQISSAIQYIFSTSI